MKKPRPKKRIPRSPDECASQLKEAFAFARAHPLSMIEMDASPDQCFQAVEEQTVLVPKPTKVLVVFSYELQRRGPCWHLSFFNRENSRELPDKTTVEAILDTVGLPPSHKNIGCVHVLSYIVDLWFLPADPQKN